MQPVRWKKQALLSTLASLWGTLTVPLNLVLGLCMLLSQQEEELGDKFAGFPCWA